MRGLLAVMGVCCVLGSGGVALAETPNWKALAGKSYEWYRSSEQRDAVVANVLAWQTDNCLWPKNVDTTAKPPTNRDPDQLVGTFDNHATTFELRFLARCQRVRAEARIEAAFLRGLETIFAAQYPSGGWPQFYPPRVGHYTAHVTLNDYLMTDLLELLRDVSQPEKDFGWVDEKRRAEAQQRLAKGLQLLLDLQVAVDGVKTIWAAQYDPVRLQPAAARKFEPISLATAESVGVMKFLATLERTPEIEAALKAGVVWFEANGIEGYRYGRNQQPMLLYPDPQAGTLWARFYEIGTNKPLFGRRDGVIVGTVDELDEERREGYAWYGDWGKSLRERVQPRK